MAELQGVGRRPVSGCFLPAPKPCYHSAPVQERPVRFTVRVGFDEVDHRYYVIDSNVPGLHVETDTFEEFVEVVQDVMPDLVGQDAAGAKVKFEREIALA